MEGKRNREADSIGRSRISRYALHPGYKPSQSSASKRNAREGFAGVVGNPQTALKTRVNALMARQRRW